MGEVCCRPREQEAFEIIPNGRRSKPHWVCPVCEEPNKPNRTQCNNCRAARPTEAVTNGRESGLPTSTVSSDGTFSLKHPHAEGFLLRQKTPPESAVSSRSNQAVQSPTGCSPANVILTGAPPLDSNSSLRSNQAVHPPTRESTASVRSNQAVQTPTGGRFVNLQAERSTSQLLSLNPRDVAEISGRSTGQSTAPEAQIVGGSLRQFLEMAGNPASSFRPAISSVQSSPSAPSRMPQFATQSVDVAANPSRSRAQSPGAVSTFAPKWPPPPTDTYGNPMIIVHPRRLLPPPPQETVDHDRRRVAQPVCTDTVPVGSQGELRPRVPPPMPVNTVAF